MTKMIAIDIAKCTGCDACELMCSFKHHGEFNPRKGRIRKTVFLYDELAVPVVCTQCEDAWCERICPSGALGRTVLAESGAAVVKVDTDKCVGCRMCMLACPFGNIEVGSSGCAEKCDLCDGDPQCVKFCARGALHFIDSEQSIVERRGKIAAQLAVAYREGE
jgi:Fe-S-cluster-containing hydrogenase component 2